MARQEQLLKAVAEIAAATEQTECLRRIEAQLRLLFPALAPEVRLGAELPATAGRHAPLRARGRLVGHLILGDDLLGTCDDAAALAAFAEHAALALDNAQLLDEHAHRARRDSLTGLRNYREFNETLAAA